MTQTAATQYIRCTLLQTVHDRQRLLCLPTANQAPPQPPADAWQKQKKKHIQQDFQETARWEHDEHCEVAIEDFIRSKLKIVNDRAGLLDVPERIGDETIAVVFL